MNRRNVNVHIMLLEMATDTVEEAKRTILQDFDELPAAGPSGFSYRLVLCKIEWLQLPLGSCCKMLFQYAQAFRSAQIPPNLQSENCDFQS
jgi:hypothetical protein